MLNIPLKCSNKEAVDPMRDASLLCCIFDKNTILARAQILP